MKLSYNDEKHAYRLTIDEADTERFPGAIPVKNRQCKSVTKVAGLADDKLALVQWGERMVAEGLSQAPHLVDSVAAHLGERGKINELCEMAKVVAGTTLASESGTTAHRVTELVDTGAKLVPNVNALRVADRWTALLDAAGLDIEPEYMERIVIYPVQRICGKFDRFARVRPVGAIAERNPELIGKLVPADLKTGKNPAKYPSSVLTQLALYANAPAIAHPWQGIDGETTRFDALPDDLDREHGFVIHLTEYDAAVYDADIALGWRCVERLIFPALKWQAIKAPEMITKVVELL